MQRTEFTLFLGEDLPRQSSSRAIGSLENHDFRRDWEELGERVMLLCCVKLI